MLNILELEPGAKVRLQDGAVAEVVANPKDGVWIELRYLNVPQNPAQEGTEELVFAESLVERA
jgi:hypothetical protein